MPVSCTVVLGIMVNSALSGVVSQRLLRKLCDRCRKAARPSELTTPPEALEVLAGIQGAEVYEPVGCEKCNGTGFRGRIAVHEVLVPDDALRKAVASGADEGELRRVAVEAGLKTMFVAALEAAAGGLTSVAQACQMTWDARARA